jgi:hypothetical protein
MSLDNDSLRDMQQGIRDMNMSKLNNECYFGCNWVIWMKIGWLSGLSLARGPSKEGFDELMGKRSQDGWGFNTWLLV